MYKIFEVSKVIAAKIPQPEFFWAAMHPILGGGIAMGLANTDKPQYIPMGGKDPVFIGTLMDRVKFYECPILPENQMLIGCSDEVKPSHFYGRINIAKERKLEVRKGRQLSAILYLTNEERRGLVCC